MMPQIENLTPLQVELCDRIWGMDTQEEIMAWFESLPRSLRHEAWAMLQMITWAVIDEEPVEDLSLARAVLSPFMQS